MIKFFYNDVLICSRSSVPAQEHQEHNQADDSRGSKDLQVPEDLASSVQVQGACTWGLGVQVAKICVARIEGTRAEGKSLILKE